MRSPFHDHHRAGAVLPDLMMSTALTLVLAAGMLASIVTLKKSAAASYHHTRSQAQQARLIDYIARDLRRAVTVSVDSFEGNERLNLTIPDYYAASGAPRDPIIQNGGITYSGGAGVPITYYKSGDKVFRTVRGAPTTLATDVQQFHFDFTDSGEQSVSVAITFVPRFQFSVRDSQTLREGTRAYATTLLRNKRTL